MISWLVGSLAFCQAGCALTLRHIEDTMRDEHKQSERSQCDFLIIRQVNLTVERHALR